MSQRIRLVPAALFLFALLAPLPAAAVITFTQLDEDVFVVSHRVKAIGSRAKASRLVFTKAASLCEAAGFSYLRVLEEESEAAQEYESANATIRVQFYWEDGEERLPCEPNADPTYIAEAGQKLARGGYVAPERPEPPALDEATEAHDCTLEQIAAMARTGLSDEQIRAACTSGGAG